MDVAKAFSATTGAAGPQPDPTGPGTHDPADAQADANADQAMFKKVIVQILNRLARTAPANADAAINGALADLGTVGGFDRTYVFCRRDGRFLDNTHEWAAPDIVPMLTMLQGMPVDIVAHWLADFENDCAVFTPDVAALPPSRSERDVLLAQDIKSILVVPMLEDGQWIGFVGYDAVRSVRDLRDDHVALLQAAANGIAALLLRRRTEQALHDSRAQLQATLAAFPDLVTEIDAAGRCMAIHSDPSGVLNGSAETMSGQYIEQAMPTELAIRTRAMMAGVDAGGRVGPICFPVTVRDQERWFESVGATRGKTGPTSHDGYVFIIRDVTDRIDAERALREREALLGGLFEQAPIGILLNEWKSGALVDVNPAFITASGQNRTALASGMVADLLPPPEKHVATAAVNALRDTSRYGPVDTFFTRADGSLFPVSVSGVSAQNTNGQRLVWNFVVDQTEQRQQEAAIRARSQEALETGQRLETALDAFPDAFVLFDKDDRLVLFNRQYPLLFPELADVIALGTHHADIVRAGIDRGIYHGLDDVLDPSLQHHLDRHALLSHESEIELTDGRIIRVIEKATPDGGRVGMRTDVTAARKAEARLSNVVEGAQVGTWEWDLASGLNVVNDRWADMLGYDLADLGPISIETWTKLGHPEDMSRSWQILDQVLNGTLAQFEYEFRMRHRIGHWVWIQSRGRVVRRNPDGRPQMMAGVHIDITTLKETEQRLEDIISGAEAGTWCHDFATKRIIVDARWAAILGRTPADFDNLTVETWLCLVHPDDAPRLAEATARAMASESGQFAHELRLRHRNGHWVWILSRGRITRRAIDGEPEIMSGIHIDITEQKARETALRTALGDLERAVAERDNAKKRFFDITDISADWFWETDVDLRFSFISESFERMTGGVRHHIGKSLDELTRTNPRLRQSADWDSLFGILAAREPFRDFVFRSFGKADTDIWVRISGSPHYNKDGLFEGYRGVGSDITALYQAKERAEKLATRDTLTGLANRAVFQEQLRLAVAQPDNPGQCGAVMMLDLDNFKTINDSFGHDAGDALLRQVANRLSKVLRNDDLIARLGGDEFTVLLPGARSEDAMDVAWRLIEALSQPIETTGQSLFVTVSIGITLYPDDGQSAVDLLQNADIAMYRAKSAGRGQFAVYKSELRQEQTLRSEMIQAMHRGLREDRFRLVAQPKFDLSDTPRIVGAEALLRWRDPDFGEVMPGEFIPLAESTGLIFEIDLMVVSLAARLLSRWQAHGVAFPLAINISAQSFQKQNIVTDILTRLAEHGVPPTLLQLEITETALMTRKDVTFRNIRKLETEGIGVIIDDFGTGYSSLSYLQGLPLAELKIDQSFVCKLGHTGAGRDAGTEAIVKAILAMTDALGMRSVAEGVETTAQRDWLRAHGCNIVQGYLLGRPAEIFAFEALHFPVAQQPNAQQPDADPLVALAP